VAPQAGAGKLFVFLIFPCEQPSDEAALALALSWQGRSLNQPVAVFFFLLSPLLCQHVRLRGGFLSFIFVFWGVRPFGFVLLSNKREIASFFFVFAPPLRGYLCFYLAGFDASFSPFLGRDAALAGVFVSTFRVSPIAD